MTRHMFRIVLKQGHWKDFIAAVNYRRAEECIASGAGTTAAVRYRHNYIDERHIAVSEEKTSVRVIEPANCENLVYFLPTPKSPHAWSRRWLLASAPAKPSSTRP